jgi:hypothetical protein
LKRSLTATTALLLAFGLLGSPVEAGPWVKAPGEAYIKTGATFFASEDSFNQGLDTGLSYTGETYNVYAEVGLPGGFQAIVNLPLVMATNTSRSGVQYHNNTLGDLTLELDYAVLPDLPLAVGVETRLPLFTPVSEQNGSGFEQSINSFPDPGDSNVDVTAKVLTGYSFHPIPAWATAELGYRARFGGFADGVYAALSTGIFVWPDHIALGLYASGVLNLQEDPDPAARLTKQFLYVQGYALITVAPVLPDMAISLSAGTIALADNTSAGNDFGVGVSYAF